MLLFVTAAAVLTFQGLPTPGGEAFCDIVQDNHGCCPACDYQWVDGKCVTKAPATTAYCKSLLRPEHMGCCRYCKFHWTGSECSQAAATNATADVVLASFDGVKGTTRSWVTVNDPVMGGASVSTFSEFYSTFLLQLASRTLATRRQVS